ncbi:protein Jumonji-like [Osmerus eperlanus]|uniref:protein Jumonji-like n=1 Tax=Osmerus eperlanus TaxID=29151 RepID=UPI002E14FFCA
MSTDRPKRNIIKKKYDDSEGMPWCEERVVRKVLFLSLREFRSGQRSLHSVAGSGGSSAKGHGLRSTPKGGQTTNRRTNRSRRLSQNQHGSKEAKEDNPYRKRPRLQVQRKFAQSQPSYPSSTPLKTTPPDIVTVALSSEMLNHRPPKTEDFLSFLCLRGTVALPGNMANLGSVQDDAGLQKEDPKDRTAVSQNSASCLVTNKSSRRQGKKMSNSAVLHSHGRCLRGREPRVSPRPGENVQGADRMEITSTTMGLPVLPARASAPNHIRYPRVSQQPPQVSMVTGLSGITSSTRTSLRNQTSPLRLLPPRAARSSGQPIKTAAPPHRSSVPPSSRLPSPPVKSPAPPSRSCLNLNKPRQVQKTKLSPRRRHSNSRLSKHSTSRLRHRNPCCPKSNPRHTACRRHSPHTNSGKNPSCIAKTSKQVVVPIQVARGQQIGHLHVQEVVQQSNESLRQSRRRRGLPAETDSVPEVMEVRLQVSGPQTRSRTLNHVGKVGRDSVVTSRHVGAVQSKPAPGQRQTGESTLTRQAQSSQG